MNFGLTEEQQLLKSSAREFFSAECPSAEVRRLMETETAHDAALWRKMAEQGWTGLPFPEEYGGMGLGLVDLAAACEEMGQALVPGAFLATVPLAGTAIYAAGSDGQKKKYLAPICGGQAQASLALLERDAGWDPGRVTLALKNGVLNGQKLFVPDADVASFLVCAVRQGAELALVMVDRHAAGVTLEAQPAIDTTRKLYVVNFCEVAAEVLATGEAARTALGRAWTWPPLR